MNNNKFATLGYVLLAIAVIIVAIVLYDRSQEKPPIIYSPKGALESIWQKYKQNFLEEGTARTIDKDRGDITTSEGEAYTMLRAVWMDDHETFDASWQWTQDNLQFKNDYIFSWLFGRKLNGTYGVLTEQNGQNSASDADTDIATALIFAYSRWRDPKYLESAQNIINSIWTNEIVMIRGKPYMAANNVEKNFNDEVLINPSYLAPYAYRMFADIDKNHNWQGVVDTSYEVIAASASSTLGYKTTAGLPPNWVAIDRNGRIISARGHDSNFGFDALRTPWRLALDLKWYGESRALALLNSFNFLNSEWNSKGLILSNYNHDGTIAEQIETPALYGGVIGAFMASDPANAKAIYDTKLAPLFNPDADSWKVPLSYYDDNLAWFGIALYNDLLPNLWQSVQ